MARRLALVALGFALAGALWLAGSRLLGGERGPGFPRGAPPPVAGPTTIPAPLRPGPEPTLDPAPPRRSAAPAPGAAPEAAAPEVPAPGRRVRGVLLHSSDRRPEPEATLVLWSSAPGAFEAVVTDAEGRFESGPLFAEGPLHVWHRGHGPDPPYEEHREVRPETVLLALTPGADAFAPIELLIVDPEAWIEVEVVSAAGGTAPAALRWLFRPPQGGWSPGTATTDAAGRARVPFPTREAGAVLQLLAHTPAEISAPVRIEAPPPEAPVRLVLDACGGLVVRVLGEDGGPLAGREVFVESPETDLRLLDLAGTTDERGEAHFPCVVPGTQGARTRSRGSEGWLRATAEVARARTAEVELREPALELAATGRVLDAAGRGVANVGIAATVGEAGTFVQTDPSGAFSVFLAERGLVRLVPALGLQEDRTEPRELTVPFGTRDVLLRVAESRPEQVVTLEIVDAESGERLPRALVLGFVEPERRGWSFHRAAEGLVAVTLRPYDDVAVAVHAVGFRRRILGAADLLREMPPGEALRVPLEHGLGRWLRVLDAEDEEPLLGAQVFLGERPLATTDGDGRAWIELSDWPAELRVRAPDHEDGTFECREWLAELGDGTVLLARRTAPR